jgi:ATP-binding cassette subfamily B protein
MEGVSVRAAGHTILEEINLVIEPGSHVAIVGQSGAGKSSLVGLLLGWHRPATGEVFVDNELLDGRHLERLRRETAWIDPAIQIWNRSLLENLQYGALPETTVALGPVIEAAALRGVLEKLPDGLQTLLGEGGGLVSGGEGQRVRIARSLSRSGVRLVVLDEPFRGLDREKRRELLGRVRTWWRESTLLCITHDVGETSTFNRVLVVEEGRIVEDGNPAALAAQPGSRYRSMLDAEESVRQGLWSSAAWRRLWLQDGHLREVERNSGCTSLLEPTRERNEIST